MDAAEISPRKSSGDASSAGGAPTRPKRSLPKLCSTRNVTRSSTSCGTRRNSSFQVTRASRTTISRCRRSHAVTGDVSRCTSGSISMPATCSLPSAARRIDSCARSIDSSLRRRSATSSEVHATTNSTRGNRSVGGPDGIGGIAEGDPGERELGIPSVPRRGNRFDRDGLAQFGGELGGDLFAVGVDVREHDVADREQQRAEQRDHQQNGGSGKAKPGNGARQNQGCEGGDCTAGIMCDPAVGL